MASSSTNDFGWNLINCVAKDMRNDNLLLSPFSISVALAMTQLGARGQTAEGMKKALCWKKEDSQIHEDFQRLLKLLKKPSDSCILRTANRIYIDKGYVLQDDFMKQSKEFYIAEPVSAHFSSNPEAERLNINKWVEDQTENKIKDLIQAGVLDSLTRLVLVNAIYFKGQWKNKFNKKMTRPAEFFLSPSTKKTVPMMHLEEKFPYRKADGFAVLELPYQDDQLSMVILLPDEQFGLEAMEQKLTIGEMGDIMSNLQSSAKVKVSLPRFEISSSFMLKEPLSQLGMSKAFDLQEADFSGMSGVRDLCISEVVHKAFLKVNEEGSEAAAATAVVVKLRCAMINNLSFTADHPFLVVIRHIPSGLILFMGNVCNPSEPS